MLAAAGVTDTSVAFVFVAGIGAYFGYYPARKAAALPMAESLRAR